MKIVNSLFKVDYTLCYRGRANNNWTCRHYIESMRNLDMIAQELRKDKIVVTTAIPFYSMTPMWMRTLLLRYKYLPQNRVINE